MSSATHQMTQLHYVMLTNKRTKNLLTLTSVALLHVLIPYCHHQGVVHNAEVTSQLRWNQLLHADVMID
jgi:hypothetical protein